MRLPQLFNRLLDSNDPAPDARAPLPKTLVEQIWESPATYNRAMRRAAHLWGRIWRWDYNASEGTRRVFAPRYLRRHFDSALLAPGHRTRRQRRTRARMLRLVGRYGL